MRYARPLIGRGSSPAFGVTRGGNGQGGGNGGGKGGGNGGGNGGGGGPGQNPFAVTVLLCGFDGADGATTFVDESLRGHLLTGNDAAQLDTAQSKFHGSSLLLDGNGDYISIPDSPDWTLSSANSDQFTVEAFVRRASVDNFHYVVGQQATSASPNAGNAWSLIILSNNNVDFYFETPAGAVVDTITSGQTIAVDTWYHLAADKDASGVIRVYIDGIMRGSSTPATSAMRSVTTSLTIGATAGGQVDYPGWIEELRITKGVARYASDGGFTVPTSAFPRA